MDLRKIYKKIAIKDEWRVRSKSNPQKLYTVCKMADGSFRCDCPAYRECRHVKMIKEGYYKQL